MKEKIVYGFLVLCFVALVGAPAVYAEKDLTEIQSEGEEEYSDPSAFEGDSDSMAGERAPENMPMDDAPTTEGVEVN